MQFCKEKTKKCGILVKTKAFEGFPQAAFALNGPFNRVSETFFSPTESLPFPPKPLPASKHIFINIVTYLKRFNQKQDCEVEEALQRKADDAAIAQVIVATIAIVAIIATNVFSNMRPGYHS